jgi:hypothetical protein
MNMFSFNNFNNVVRIFKLSSSYVKPLNKLYGQRPRQHVLFIKYSQLFGKGLLSLVRLPPESIPVSIWPMAGYQEVTPALYLAGILQVQTKYCLSSVHKVCF